MRNILLIILLLSTNVYADFLWKPESITFEIKHANKLLDIGYMLELNQKLEPGETGWTMIRIDIPESWVNAKLEMQKGTIVIKIGKHEFYLNKNNQGKLSYAILNGGNKTDKQLLKIWIDHAKDT